jgi:hypothetical protein
MSRDTPWTGPDKIIRKAFRSNESYGVIDNYGLGDTWLAGGCWVAAEAIQRRFGGEMVGIWDRRVGLTHVAVEKRGVIIDADGKPLPRAGFLKRYTKQEQLVPPVTVEAFKPSDAERGGLVHSPEAVDEAVVLLGGAKTNTRRSYTFINPADVTTTAEGYFVKKGALRKIQKAMYEKTGDWLDLDDVERAVNAMLLDAARRKWTIVEGKKLKRANPQRSYRVNPGRVYEGCSEEYGTLRAAEAAYKAGETVKLLDRLEAAEKAYGRALRKITAKWGTIPRGNRKDSAEENANDTCHAEKIFPYEDQVAYWRCAVNSYDFTE